MESDLETIKQRNIRVESDKAWETSKTRRVIITILTYVVASIFLKMIGNNKPIINAFIPAGGYLLSTLSLPVIKEWWIKQVSK